MCARKITVLLCALLCACSGKGRQESIASPGAALKPGKALVVVGIGLPTRELNSGAKRIEVNHLNLEFARLDNGRAENGISVAEPSKWEVEVGPPVVYRVLQVDAGTYALARASSNADLEGFTPTSPMARSGNRTPFIVHELASDTAYQFKVAEGEVAYVGDYTVDLSYKPTRITVGHTLERAAVSLRKYPQFGSQLADKSPLLPTPTGLPPHAMQTNDAIRNRLQLPPTCPPACN